MRKSKSLYQYYLSLVLLVAIVPLVATSIAMFSITQKRAETDALRTNKAYIQSACSALETQITWLKRAVILWSENDDIRTELSVLWNSTSISTFSEYNGMQTILSMLNSMEKSADIIDHIDIYLPKTKMLFSNTGSCAPVINTQQLAFYQQTELVENGTIVSYFDNSPAIVRHISNHRGQNALFILVLHRQTLNELARHFCMSTENSIALFSGEGVQIGSWGANTDLCEQLISLNTNKDRIKDSRGSDYMVLREETPDGILNYVLLLPSSQVLKPLTDLCWLFLLTTLSCMFLAAIIAWQTSRKLYHPIKKLADTMTVDARLQPESNILTQIGNAWNHTILEKTDMEHKLREGFALFRESFLLKLLYSADNYSEENIRQDFSRVFGKKCPAYCLLVYMRLFGNLSSSQDMQASDIRLLSLATYELVNDMLKKEPEIDAIPILTDDNAMCLLFLFSDDGIQQENILVELVRTISDQIHEKLNVYVASAISRSSSCLTHVSKLLDEAKRLCGYQKLLLENQILRENVQPSHDSAGTRYPFELEQKLVHALFSEDDIRCECLIRELFEYFSQIANVHLYSSSVLQLYIGLQKAMLKNGFLQEQILDERLPNVILTVPIAECADRFIEWVLHPYLLLIREAQNSRQKEAVLVTIEAIQKNYMEDVSLDNYADLQGINVASLSRAFKRFTGQSFIDYLTSIRIEKAKELLINSDLKICEIAEQVGYRVTYFNRVFRAHENITPSDFRSSHMVNSSVENGQHD